MCVFEMLIGICGDVVIKLFGSDFVVIDVVV